MSNSTQLFSQAKQIIPGGVNSPVRAFHGVSGEPVFIKRAQGAYLFDVDNNAYLDYVCSWGPIILGHAHPAVVAKVMRCVEKGFGFGATTEIEVRLAQKICETMPSIEMVRFVSSGTEAAMSAIRLARGFARRNKIIKFSGCYHGHTDSLLVAAGSGGLTFGVPHSAGVPKEVAQHTLIADFNNLEQVEALFKQYGNDIAAVIVEPVAANMNLVLPTPGYLQGLREICDRYESLLIFDEVITGFRIALGGAQSYYQVKPDLTVLGKIIGGGFPAAAFGGRADIMQYISPLGPVYQAGTLSGNPVAMTAGLATLELISASNFYDKLTQHTERLVRSIVKLAQAANIPFYAQSISSLFGFYFTSVDRIENEKDVKMTDIDTFKKFFHGMFKEGIYLAPSAFEVGFVSAAHSEHDIDKTLAAAEKVFGEISENI